MACGTTDRAVPNLSASVAPGYMEYTASAISNHSAGSWGDHAGSLALVTSLVDMVSSSVAAAGAAAAAGKTKTCASKSPQKLS